MSRITTPIPVTFSESRLVIENLRHLDLSGKPTMTKLLKLFFRQSCQVFSKRNLIDGVYSRGRLERPSLRLMDSYNTNLVKMISRARRFLNREIPCLAGERVTWLPYDQDEKGWRLCQRIARTGPPPHAETPKSYLPAKSASVTQLPGRCHMMHGSVFL